MIPHILAFSAGLAALLAAGPASGHQLRVVALAEGETIHGYAYFVGGPPVRNAPVAIHGPDGALLGETQTNGFGEFRFEPDKRVDHVITVDLADGHRGVYTVTEAELPASLGEPETPDTHSMDAAEFEPEVLANAIAEAVGRQIRPLREDIRRMEDRRQFRDIAGGIGYIAGLAGLYALLRGRSKQ